MESDPKKQSDLKYNTSQKTTPVGTFAPLLKKEQKEEQDISLNKTLNKDGDHTVIQNQSGKKTEKNQSVIGNTIRRIRTYKEDVASVVRLQKASLTSIAAAEQKRHTSIPRDIIKEHQIDFKKIGIIFLSVTLIVSSIGVVGFFMFFYEKEKVVIEQEIPSFIFVEEQKGIDVTGKNARDILKALGDFKSTVSLPLGQITHLYITETTEELEAEVTRIISAEEFLTNIRVQVSSAFLRSLEPSFMLGIHAFDQNQPFIIFKSNSYQHSFAGLLEWERTMYQDLSLFMGRRVDPVLGVPIHPQTGEEIVLRENFEDKIIQNIDVRALLSEAGDIELLYAFPNQQTLIIATNENTLTEIITRLNSVRVF